MSELKGGLQSMFDALKDLETRARELQNQNLADIAASAHGKVKQLHDHPDLELVEDKPAEVEQTADFHGTDDQFTTAPPAPFPQPQQR